MVKSLQYYIFRYLSKEEVQEMMERYNRHLCDNGECEFCQNFRNFVHDQNYDDDKDARFYEGKGDYLETVCNQKDLEKLLAKAMAEKNYIMVSMFGYLLSLIATDEVIFISNCAKKKNHF